MVIYRRHNTHISIHQISNISKYIYIASIHSILKPQGSALGSNTEDTDQLWKSSPFSGHVKQSTAECTKSSLNTCIYIYIYIWYKTQLTGCSCLVLQSRTFFGV